MANSELAFSTIEAGTLQKRRLRALADIGSFWRLQTAGWFAYLVVYFFGALANGEPVTIFWASLSTAIAGFALTSLMRSLLMKVWEKPVTTAAGTALMLSLLFAIPFSAVSETSYWLATGGGWRLDEPITYFGSAFWCGSILLTWVGIYFGIEYYRQAQHERAAALEAESVAHQAQLEALCYQLNPHFLFNTLNGISTLILDGKNRMAGEMVEQLGQLLRESLEGDPQEKVSIVEEVRLAQIYLAIEKVRFDDRLDVAIDIEDAAREARVPRLILQPLIENAIRHAVEPGGERVVVRISVKAPDDCLHIAVTDTGPGMGNSGIDGHGLGHRNIRQRLAALYGERHRFTVGSQSGGGARIVIEIPLEYAT